MDFDASLIARIIDLGITIQQIPAPPFGEAQRAAFIQERFHVEGLQQVSMDTCGNVFGCLRGRGERRPLVISAHLDTVFPFDTDLQVNREADKIFGPGIGDNSISLAGLFGVIWALRQAYGANPKLPGDLWLAANVGEEGLGDLRGMRAVVERFGENALAYIVLEGMALGQVYHRALGVRRYRITTQTAGGHSWVDYGRPSAIHELAELITQLTGMSVPARPRSSLNVGVISGGTSINTIAPEAHLELDLRSEGAGALASMTRRVEALVQAAKKPGVRIRTELIGQRPAGRIPASHPLVRLAQRSLRAQGLKPNLMIGSTDANVPLSQGLPAVTVGLTTGFGAHTINEYIHSEPLSKGMAQVLDIIEGAFQILAN